MPRVSFSYYTNTRRILSMGPMLKELYLLQYNRNTSITGNNDYKRSAYEKNNLLHFTPEAALLQMIGRKNYRLRRRITKR